MTLLEQANVVELAQGFDADGEVGHLSADFGSGHLHRTNVQVLTGLPEAEVSRNLLLDHAVMNAGTRPYVPDNQ